MTAKKKTTLWPADKVVRKPIAWFKPFAKNPKLHSKVQVQQLRASIEKWGWTIPVLADAKGEVIAGHGRLLAAQLEPPIDTVPVMIAEGWSEADRRAYRIADNKLTENGSWDDTLLRAEVQALSALSFKLDLVGFTVPEIRDLTGAIDPLQQLPQLPAGDKSPFEQITFTLHTSQVKDVRAAMKAADAMGSYGGSPNDNKNGNAITRVSREFLKSRKKPAKAKSKGRKP